MKKQSLFKNFIYQFLYQALILIIPLILASYLARVLKETALGTYTYVNSISYYFIILSNLGINVHGKRIISKVSDNSINLRKTFWSLYAVHAIASLISILLYLLCIMFFVDTNKNLYFINIIYVASALFDITWLFYGLENFSSVVIKNALIKIVVCIFVFSLVKVPSDIWKYALIVSLGHLLGNLIMIPQAIKNIKPIKISINDLKIHIKPIFVFSVSIIAVTLYTVFDKTLIGLMSTKENVAFYEYSNQIISVPQTFVGIIGSVMLPRACRLVNVGNTTEQKRNIKISLLITAFIGIGSIFGLLLIGNDLAYLYYGESFAECGKIMIALSPLVYIVGAGSVIRSQCLIPNGMDKEFNFSILYNAIINVILSILLIPFLGVYGAIVGTIVAEMFGFFYQIYLSRNILDKSIFIKTLIPFIVSGMLMYIFTKLIITPDNVIKLIFTIIIAVFIYCVILVLYMYIFEND